MFIAAIVFFLKKSSTNSKPRKSSSIIPLSPLARKLMNDRPEGLCFILKMPTRFQTLLRLNGVQSSTFPELPQSYLPSISIRPINTMLTCHLSHLTDSCIFYKLDSPLYTSIGSVKPVTWSKVLFQNYVEHLLGQLKLVFLPKTNPQHMSGFLRHGIQILHTCNSSRGIYGQSLLWSTNFKEVSCKTSNFSTPPNFSINQQFKHFRLWYFIVVIQLQKISMRLNSISCLLFRFLYHLDILSTLCFQFTVCL